MTSIGVRVSVTSAIAVSEQPPGAVTVSRKIPGVVTTGFCRLDENPKGPFQANVDPGMEEVAVNSTEAFVQLSSPPVTATIGIWAELVTTVVATALHPLDEVAVTVYVPGAVTTGF